MPRYQRTQASEMGKKGGKSGGPARAKKLSRGERSQIASKGGKAKAQKYGGRKKGGGKVGP